MTGLSPSTLYYKPRIPRVRREELDADLRDMIEALQVKYPCCRGYRMVRVYLKRDYSLTVNPKKIRRIMRKYELIRRSRRRFVVTTDSKHGFPVYPNLIKGLDVTGIDQVWLSDITYIRILTGFVYLAVILDVYSRKVVGWALSKNIDHLLTLEALKMALRNRKPVAGLIHHSDRGVQYACTDYTTQLKDSNVKISMSRSGSPYDNAHAERIMRTIKQEEVYLKEYETFTDVIDNIPGFIEDVYNKKRVHSALGYLTPVEFESILQDEEKKKEYGQVTLKLWNYVSR
jgi:transposase InsO family protein